MGKGDSQAARFLIQDAGWGWGPASNGKTLFARPSGSGCRLGCRRTQVPGDGGAIWGERCQRGEVVAAVSGDRQRGGRADGRVEAVAAAERAGGAAGADRRESGLCVSSPVRRVSGTW